MSESFDATMWGAGPNREVGDFYHDKRALNGTQDRMQNNHGCSQTNAFENHQTGNEEKNRGRNTMVSVNNILDENLTISVGSSSDSRHVAIGQSNINEIGSGSEGANVIRRGQTRQRPHNSIPFYKTGSSERPPASNPSHGFKILIPLGIKFQKEFILNRLRNLIAPDDFVPIMWRLEDRSVVFWVDDQRISQRLRDCDGKIQTDEGFRMRIRVAPGFPRYVLNRLMKDMMREAIISEYVTSRKALDLSCFHRNPVLVNDCYCSLTRTPIMVTAMKMVVTAMPDLVELSLDNNQLHNLESLFPLRKLPCLKMLSLCNNRIKELDELNHIKDLKLDELRLSGNPVCQNYSDRQDQYVSDIRAKFPDLLRLDGFVVQRAMGFELAADRFVEPSFQRCYTPSGEVRQIATEFLGQYFKIFDSQNRQPLLDAYDESASFSMTVSLPYADKTSDIYCFDSRNLFIVVEPSRRRKLLKQGRLPVVAHISELPRSQHDFDSFTMDIGLVTARMMLVTVTGIFKELGTAVQPVRYFTRTFIIVPKGSGYCIINEMLQITNPTKRQEQEAFRLDPSIESDSKTTSTTTSTTINDDARAQMTRALRERTNMNLEWTLKCLNDVQWDFNDALAAFQACHSRGEIPPNAFQQ